MNATTQELVQLQCKTVRLLFNICLSPTFAADSPSFPHHETCHHASYPETWGLLLPLQCALERYNMVSECHEQHPSPDDVQQSVHSHDVAPAKA